MGLAGVDRQGLTFGELRRFNPDFQDLLGDRVRMWLPGASGYHATGESVQIVIDFLNAPGLNPS